MFTNSTIIEGSLNLYVSDKRYVSTINNSNQKEIVRKLDTSINKNRKFEISGSKKRQEGDRFTREIKYRRALLVFYNSYISVCENFERKNRRKQLDKITQAISNLKL